MKIQNEIEYFKKLFGFDDVEVEFSSRRGKFPNGTVYPNMNKIVIEGTMTSLARWGLVEILLHEFTHYKLRVEGYEKWYEHDEVFWRVYNQLRKEYEDLVMAKDL